MSVIVRDDGIRFVLRTYRELLKQNRRSLLKQQLRFLAGQYGQYVYLAPSKTDSVSLKAVFSMESGYLLGESVWQHLERPHHFIYCERHPEENEQAIVIVVIDDHVHIDTILMDDEITPELLPLFTLSVSFELITFGNLSIKLCEDNEETDHLMALPKSMINQHRSLTTSLILELPAYPEYELHLLPKVLTSKLLQQSIPWPPIAILIILLVLVSIWFFYPAPPETTTIQSVAPATIDSSAYAEFYQALNVPNAQALITNLIQIINNISALPGWQLQTVNYDGAEYHFALNRLGGDIRWFNRWAKKNDYVVMLTTNGADLTVSNTISARPKPQQIYYSQQILSFIDEQLSVILSDRSLLVGAAQTYSKVQSIPITLNLNSASPSLLTLISQVLGNDLPITINHIQFSVDEANLLNGTIQFSVWGK